MNHLIGCALLCLASTAHAEYVTVLETPSYLVKIDVRCAEGNVTCENVIYTGTNRKSGKSITVKGRTMHSKCADGVTPCAFQGYFFKNGAVAYMVLNEGELTVIRGNRTLLQERGEWK